MHNYHLCMKVIKLYKMDEKSEEKIFRRGYYPLDFWLFRGCGGIYSKYITFAVCLYSINHQNR